VTYTVSPTGGVTKPSSSNLTSMMPNQIKSMPDSRARGKTIGKVSNSSPMESRKQPMIRYSMDTARMTAHWLLPKLMNQSVMNTGTPLSTIKRPSNTVPITTMNIPAVPVSVRVTDLYRFPHVSERRTIANTMDKAAPTAPASVGVNTPTKIPTSTPMISTGNGQTFFSAAILASRLNVS